jgi:hypothetical protein
MILYVIYEKPSDFPNDFVVRRWTTIDGKPVAHASPHAITPTLEAARESIPPGLYCLPRFDQDDPVIREVWL